MGENNGNKILFSVNFEPNSTESVDSAYRLHYSYCIECIMYIYAHNSSQDPGEC